jgi:hypothetical protein
MSLMLSTERKYSSLTMQDCERILRSLNAGLAILATNRKLPPLSELQAKSLLTVLRNEIKEAANSLSQPGGQLHA